MSALDTPHRTVHGHREVRERPDEIVDLARGRPMPTSLQCGECLPEVRTFSGPGYWNEFARHLQTEHPQTIPTPPQREPEPPAAKTPAAIAGRKEPPAMVDTDEICPVPGCGKKARHGARHRNQGSKGNGGGPAMQSEPTTTPTVAVKATVGAATVNGEHIETTLGTDPLLEQITRRAEAARHSLDRFGWHLDGCPAYDHATGDGPASKIDDRETNCRCGFRTALAEAMVS